MALPLRALLSLLETLGTIATSSKCPRWVSACWKEVGEWAWWGLEVGGADPGLPDLTQCPPVSPVNQLHFIPVDLGAPIVQCAVADPYVVIMSAEGHVTMFLLKTDSYGGRHHRLALHKPPLHHVGHPVPQG